jgi:hypothetical protein
VFGTVLAAEEVAMAPTMTDGPVRGEAAWRGDDLRRHPGWIERWSPAELAAFDDLVARRPAPPIEGLIELGPDDLALPAIEERVARWRPTLFGGRGLLLVRGLPVERWTDDESGLVYWAIGQAIGMPIAQNPANEVLGHVTDTGRQHSDPQVRLYQTNADIRYHVDGAAVVGLACLRTARSGGASRVMSSVTVHDEVWRRRPDLAPELFGRFPVDRRDEQAPGEEPYWLVPMARWDGDRLRTFFHADYMASSQRHPTAPRFTESQRQLLELIDEIGADPDIHLDMEFRPGDIQLIANETTVHARTGYVDWPDPDRRRHLLRLWLDRRRPGDRRPYDATRFGSRGRP